MLTSYPTSLAIEDVLGSLACLETPIHCTSSALSIPVSLFREVMGNSYIFCYHPIIRDNHIVNTEK
ncbi:hypothetical protein C1A50_2524 [Paenibacillus polymyxa]|nr:hypothetical protein C1A50_2524 [Paenibacillus polymyxa]